MSEQLEEEFLDPAPHVLWAQADREMEDLSGLTTAMGIAWRRARYLELMREHGYIVPREPGDDSPMFACGYQPNRDTRTDLRRLRNFQTKEQGFFND